jgi:hypothetical protein
LFTDEAKFKFLSINYVEKAVLNILLYKISPKGLSLQNNIENGSLICFGNYKSEYEKYRKPLPSGHFEMVP